MNVKMTITLQVLLKNTLRWRVCSYNSRTDNSLCVKYECIKSVMNYTSILSCQASQLCLDETDFALIIYNELIPSQMCVSRTKYA